MIPYEDFNHCVDAHFDYALTLPVEEAAEVFRRRMADRSWLSAPAAWAGRFTRLIWNSSDEGSVRSVLDAASVTLAAGPIGDVHHAVLVPLLQVEGDKGWRGATVRALAEWFARVAEPGDASLAADIVETVTNVRPDLCWAVAPVADWLVEHGCVELQARRRLRVALRVVDIVDKHGVAENLLAAVRCALDNEEKLQSLGLFDGENFHPEFLALILAIDRLVRSDEATPEIVGALVRSYSDGGSRLIATLAARQDLTAIRAAIFVALAGGLVVSAVAEGAWRHICGSSEAPDALVFRDRETVLAALRALASQTFNDGTDVEEGWALLLTSELFRFSNEITAADLELVARCVGRDGHEAMENGVRAAVRNHNHALANVRLITTLLDQQPARSGAVFAALKLVVPTTSTVEATSAAEEFEQGVKEGVERILGAVANHRYVEIATHLRSCEGLIYEDQLADDYKVRVEPPLLRVDRGAIRSLLRSKLPGSELIAAGISYVVHEVVHLCQRIDDKADVARLRSTGAETSLMHIDLGADHEAAMVIAAAIPELSVTRLKDIGGRSLVSFPTEAHHTTAARSRKAHRLVGARLDYLTRKAGVLPPEADEYAFADYGPSGGNIVLMRSGPPWSVIGIVPLSHESARVLYSAADQGTTDAIDEILRRAIVHVLSKQR